MSRVYRFTLIMFLTFCVIGWNVSPAQARGFRVGLLPNGPENNCSNCHVSAGGAGPRNPFGEDVLGLVSPGGREDFWTSTFAAEDSDGDGFTNGVELGDIDGDGVPERTVNISAPGDPNSGPLVTLGDCNLDTALDGNDLSCVSDIEARDAVLGALNSFPGDFDGDGTVGFPDFLVLSNNFGTESPAYTDGNVNLSGPIDFADFLVLSANFGATAAEAKVSAVPEPNAGLLLCAGVTPLLWYRKRRRCA